MIALHLILNLKTGVNWKEIVDLKENLCIAYTGQHTVSVLMVCLLFLSDDRKGQYPAFDWKLCY